MNERIHSRKKCKNIFFFFPWNISGFAPHKDICKEGKTVFIAWISSNLFDFGMGDSLFRRQYD